LINFKAFFFDLYFFNYICLNHKLTKK
jgi:hypothetical protein